MGKNKKTHKILKVIIILIVVVAISWIVFVAVDSIMTQKTNHDIQIKYLNAMLADVNAVTVKNKDGKDITDEFFEKYTSNLENGDYDTIIQIIRENEYTYSILETPRNLKYLSD